MVTSEPTRFQTEPISRPITPAADDGQLLGHGFLIQGAFVVHDDFLVDRNMRQVTGLGAGGHDHVLGQHFLGTNLDLPQIAFLGDEGTVTGQQGDLVLLEQALDAGSQLGRRWCPCGPSSWHVDARLADLDALGFKAVTGLFEQVRGVQQRLGRDTADVQAGTAKTRFALRVGIRIGFGSRLRKNRVGRRGSPPHSRRGHHR
jgi:hypothetical protein